MSMVLPIAVPTGTSSNQMACHAAEVLAELAAEIELLGAQLCTNPAVVSGHLSTLQGIDMIAQKLSALSHMLAAECPVTAVEQLGLESLRQRFAAQHAGANTPFSADHMRR